LRLLVDRRRALGEEHTRKGQPAARFAAGADSRGAKKNLSAAQARKLLAGVGTRDVVGKTRKRVAAELVVDLERLYARKKAANKETDRARGRDRHQPARPARHRRLGLRPTPRRGR
jgi:hypothetical protein